MSSSKEGKGSRFTMTRGTFLKVSAFIGAAVDASRIMKYPRINSLVSPQERPEGVIAEKWITAFCFNCSTRCATQVRVVNGKAVKIGSKGLIGQGWCFTKPIS